MLNAALSLSVLVWLATSMWSLSLTWKHTSLQLGEGELFLLQENTKMVSSCALAPLESMHLRLRLPTVRTIRLPIGPGDFFITHEFSLPLWFPPALFGVWTVVAALCNRRRLTVGCCQACGYDLTGNVSGTCPECGHHIGMS